LKEISISDINSYVVNHVKQNTGSEPN